MYTFNYRLLLSTLTTALVTTACSTPPLATAPVDPANNQPILQLNPGGHLAMINDIAFTPDGKYLVSAGDDKQIQVWNLAQQRIVRTLRGQIGAGPEGKIYAMALSPDGTLLAAGGWMKISGKSGHHIRLYDFASGELLALLTGHENVVNALAFSPNGRYLVSGSGDFNAMVWDIATRSLRHSLRGHTDYIYAVAFTPDSGRVVTGSFDHSLRLWEVASGALIQDLTGHRDKVQSVAVAADGSIASGDRSGEIRRWDGSSGKLQRVLANPGTVVGSLSFNAAGTQLLASCGGGGCASTGAGYLYSYPTGELLHTYRGHNNIVLATAFSPDGRWAATGGGSNQEIHLWSTTDGTLHHRLAGSGTAVWAVGFSPDGTEVWWGNTWTEGSTPTPLAKSKLQYQLRLPDRRRGFWGEPAPLQPGAAEGIRAITTWRHYSLHHRTGDNYGDDAILDLLEGDTVIASIERDSTNGYDHRAYTFTPDGETIISGGAGGVVTAYARTGREQGKFVGHTGDVWAVAVSPDGQLLVSGSADQTVRLWNVATRENLVTLFRGQDQQWVLWTPQGYYAASADGDRMLGWQINRGAAHTPDFVAASQLRSQFYRPDIITQTITLRSATQAIAQAPNTQFNLQNLVQAQPPKFHIVNPSNGYKTSRAQVELELNIPAQPEELERVNIYINGRLANLLRLGKTSLPQTTGSKREVYPVTLQAGENLIRIVAVNRIGETSQELTVFLKAQADSQPQGDLYLVAIGVSNYDLKRLNLQFPAADARDFQQAMLQHAGSLYRKIHTRLLTTADGGEPPTANGIRDALDLFSQSTPSDTAILFVAGHGINYEQGSGYYFLPQNAEEHPSGGWKSSSIIKWYDLLDALVNTTGQRILFVDTCHSGAAFNPRLLKDSGDERILVFSASDANTSAQEIVTLGHGVFTYAILEGLSGKADLMPDNKIMLKELDTYVSSRVPQLTENLQIPVIHTPGGFVDIVFANK